MMDNTNRSRGATIRLTNANLTQSDVINAFEEREDIEISSVRCIQKAIDGSVLLSFCTESAAEYVRDLDVIVINRTPVVVSSVNAKIVRVKVYYLPYEVTNDELKEVMADFGHVFKVSSDKCVDSMIENGIRTVEIRLECEVPSFITVKGFETKIWYPRQPLTCRN